ncbi:MAG: nucleotidyltransferase family protein [Haliscomenobacter sp.]|nr:nucleotidyltransferase family protein [Haliscomenobacter sp.]
MIPAFVKVSAILLAAGESRRMGAANKLFLEVGGKSMIQTTLDALCESPVAEIIVVSNPENFARLDDRIRSSFRIVINPDFQLGMTTSIQKGIKQAAGDADGYMICMSDQPFLPAAEYTLLIEGFSAALREDPFCILVPFYREKKGNPVVFSNHYREDLLAHPDMDGCKGIIEKNRAHVVRQNMPTNAVLRDIDTPEDYSQVDHR